jgi:Ca2+-transporting ATPase
LAVLVFGELFKAFAFRSPTRVFWQVGAFSNLVLLGVVMASIVVQLAIFRIAVLQQLFGIGTVSATDLMLCFAAGLVPVTVIEVAKLVRR